MSPESAQGLPELEEQYVVLHFGEFRCILDRMQKVMYYVQTFIMQRGHRLR